MPNHWKAITPDYLLKCRKEVLRKWANYTVNWPVRFRLPHPVVSFTFDDAPGSAFDNGGSILEKYGYRGTYYVAFSFLDENEDDHFTIQQVQQALQKGHEIGGHTREHIDFSMTPFREAKLDVMQNEASFKEILPALQFKNFSYPFGAQTRAIKKFISTKFRSARGVKGGIHYNRLDLYNLKGERLYERSMAASDVHELLDELSARMGWLIFYTHDVANDYSPYGCSPGLFETAVSACHDREIPVMTVDKALDLIGAHGPGA